MKALYLGTDDALKQILAELFGTANLRSSIPGAFGFDGFDVYSAIIVDARWPDWQFAVQQLVKGSEFVVVAAAGRALSFRKVLDLGAKQMIGVADDEETIRAALEGIGLLGKIWSPCPVIATASTRIFGGVVVNVRAQLVSGAGEAFSVAETLRRAPRTAVYVTIQGIVPPHPDAPFRLPMLAEDFVPMWQAPTAAFVGDWSLCVMLESGEAPCGLKDARALFAVLLKTAFRAAWGIEEPKFRLEFTEVWTDPSVEEGTEES